MVRSGPWRVAVLYLALCIPASAQVVWDLPNIVVPPTKFDKSAVPARADVWPRLDPGATICKSQADLLRLAEVHRGIPGQRPNCQFIQSPTAVTILRRAGPGQTEVSMTNQTGVGGWTDAYLPERALPPGGKGVQIK
jgi:hypothetical protein